MKNVRLSLSKLFQKVGRPAALLMPRGRATHLCRYLIRHRKPLTDKLAIFYLIQNSN